MSSNTDNLEVVRVSRKGQATIPKALREKFGIEAPGEVFVYEDAGRIVVEPVPTLSELHGIHAGEHEPGVAMERVRELREREQRLEREDAERLLDPSARDEEE